MNAVKLGLQKNKSFTNADSELNKQALLYQWPSLSRSFALMQSRL